AEAGVDQDERLGGLCQNAVAGELSASQQPGAPVHEPAPERAGGYAIEMVKPHWRCSRGSVAPAATHMPCVARARARRAGSQSTFRPAARTTAPQSFISWATCCLNSSWLKVDGSAEFAVRISFILGCCTAFIASACRRWMIGAGVPPGANRPVLQPISQPGMTSASTGVSGYSAVRFGAVIPSSVRRPALMCGIAAEMQEKYMLASPATRAAVAGLPPL